MLHSLHLWNQDFHFACGPLSSTMVVHKTDVFCHSRSPIVWKKFQDSKNSRSSNATKLCLWVMQKAHHGGWLKTTLHGNNRMGKFSIKDNRLLWHGNRQIQSKHVHLLRPVGASTALLGDMFFFSVCKVGWLYLGPYLAEPVVYPLSMLSWMSSAGPQLQQCLDWNLKIWEVATNI